MIYNHDFVTKNFNLPAELKGIFTLGEKNVDTTKRIGGTLTEQIPPAEHIKEVERLLKNATPKLELDERGAGGLLGKVAKKSK